MLSPYQNIQPFKGFYVYLHGIGEIFNLHAFVRLAAAVARRTGLFLSPDSRPKGDRIWQLPGVGAAVHGAGFCLCPQHLAAQGRKLPYHRSMTQGGLSRLQARVHPYVPAIALICRTSASASAVTG